MLASSVTEALETLVDEDFRASKAQEPDRHLARWWSTAEDGRLSCKLCPRLCQIGEGQRGFCHVRRNEGGRLWLTGYGHPSAVAIDPIEKKPLYHFLPGSQILSLGNLGCNFGCRFCQNWEIARASRAVNEEYLSPTQAVELALAEGTPSIAYTYNEPTVWAEYAIDIAREARHAGVRNVLVTNGYITDDAFHDLYDLTDAANVDLKAFDENFYGRLTLAHLQPVLDTLVRIHNETSVWLEITNLVIPGENDSDELLRQLCGWITSHLGADVPLHFSAFHPEYKMSGTPRTPRSTLETALRLARAEGLRHVYLGNVNGGGDTLCPNCHVTVLRRDWMATEENNLQNGRCPNCHAEIAGVWR